MYINFVFKLYHYDNEWYGDCGEVYFFLLLLVLVMLNEALLI